MLLGTLAGVGRAAMSSLWRELADWKPTRERAAFGAEAMLSVVLSVAVAHALHLSYTWWAAISGFAVMQTSFAGSLERAFYRIAGTAIGAAIGTIGGPLIGDRPWLFVPALGAMAGVAVYYGNGSRAVYAWVLGGVTALMVTYEAHALLSLRSTASFAALRVAEVLVGTLSCVLVTSTFHFGPTWYRMIRPPAVMPDRHADTPGATAADAGHPPPPNPLRETRMLLCLQGGLAVSLLAALAYFLHLPGFAQALVTVIAVLILPAGLPANGTRQPVIEKMVHRVAGCLLAGALGVALLPLMQGQEIPCLIVLSVGVWIGCHVQTGHAGASYIGRQFTIAFIMVFVQDHHWSADPVPALMRLSGILAGIVILTVVMVATSRLDFSPPASDAVR